MILKSSSNHHPLNMRLLLIVLTCLAATLAAPQLKQKRDILPGDPRYGTDYHHEHHHHPETVVESTRSIGGYAYSIPETPLQLPQDTYGPPNYQPGLSLNTDYLPPRVVTPGPSYGEHIDFNAPLEIAPEESAVVDVKTVSSTPLPLPLEKVQPVTLSPLTTSYGTPVVDHVKTSVRTVETPLKTVKTEIHGHSTLDLPKSVLKVKEQLPLVQGVTQYTTGVKSVSPVTTTLTKNYVSGSLINKSLPTLHSAVGLVPTFNAVPYAPSVFDQSTLVGAHADFSGYGAGLTSIHGLKSLNTDAPLTSVHGLSSSYIGAPQTTFHVAKTIPTLHAVQHQTYGVPYTNVQFSKSPIHVEQNIAPVVKTFEAVTPTPILHTVKSVGSLTHAHPVHTVRSYQPSYQSSLNTVETLSHQPLHQTLTHVEPVHTVKTLDTLTYANQPLHQTLTHIEPVHTVKTLDTPTPLHHAPALHSLTHIEPAHTVKTLETPVHHVPSFQTYQPVRTAHIPLPTIQPLTSVKTVETLQPVHHVESVKTVHHVQPVTSIKSVKTVTPVHHVESVPTHPIESVETLHHPVDSVDVLPAVQRTQTYTQTAPVHHKNVNVHVQKDAVSDFFSNLGASFPTLPTLPQLPQLPQLPSLPSFQFPSLQPTTTTSPLEVSTVVNTYVSEDQAKDSITVDNPLFRVDNLPNHVVAQHVTPSKEYVQPTDENGGYVY